MAYAVESGKPCAKGYGLRIVAEPPSTEVKRWCFTLQEMIARAPAWQAARDAKAAAIEPGGITYTPPAEAVTVEAGVAPSGSFALLGIPWWAWAGGAVGVWFVFFRKN
jgi:hypothetical protein